jgi:hypothetical protein
MFRETRKCSPFDPKYPTMTPKFRHSSRCTFTFQLWIVGFRKSASTDAGARPAAWATVSALSRRIDPAGPVKVRGVTFGGLPAVGVTMFVTGWSLRSA